MLKNALLTATAQSHIAQFHEPAIRLLKANGYEVHVAARDAFDLLAADRELLQPMGQHNRARVHGFPSDAVTAAFALVYGLAASEVGGSSSAPEDTHNPAPIPRTRDSHG